MVCRLFGSVPGVVWSELSNVVSREVSSSRPYGSGVDGGVKSSRLGGCVPECRLLCHVEVRGVRSNLVVCAV